MTAPKERARRCILWYVTSFCLTTIFEERQRFPSSKGFVAAIGGAAEPQVGDLAALGSAPVSKWYLSWIIEIERFATGNRYLLESIEDGELSWWENVGISYLEREVVLDHPEWRWTDRQHAFNDRWRMVCFKERDAYITLPTMPVFGDGFSVTLGTRTRFSLNDHRPVKTFPDWRKVTKTMMAEFYDECAAHTDSQ